MIDMVKRVVSFLAVLGVCFQGIAAPCAASGAAWTSDGKTLTASARDEAVGRSLVGCVVGEIDSVIAAEAPLSAGFTATSVPLPVEQAVIPACRPCSAENYLRCGLAGESQATAGLDSVPSTHAPPPGHRTVAFPSSALCLYLIVRACASLPSTCIAPIALFKEPGSTQKAGFFFFTHRVIFSGGC